MFWNRSNNGKFWILLNKFNHYIICKDILYWKTECESIISKNVDFIAKIEAYFYSTSEFGFDVHNQINYHLILFRKKKFTFGLSKLNCSHSMPLLHLLVPLIMVLTRKNMIVFYFISNNCTKNFSLFLHSRPFLDRCWANCILHLIIVFLQTYIPCVLVSWLTAALGPNYLGFIFLCSTIFRLNYNFIC